MEDLFSSIVVAIIAIISIIIKAVGNKPQKSPKQEPFGGDIFRPEPQSIPLPQQQKVEQSSHPDSMETIFDEITDSQSAPQSVKRPQTKAKAEQKKSARIVAGQNCKNATNRTFKRETEEGSREAASKKNGAHKFNLREAVIYSEILTPKFKNEE